MQWPKTESGAVDWETAFEDPAKGLIPLVMAARTPAKVRKVTAVLVSTLFIPGSTPAKRSEYSAALANLMAKDKPDEAVLPDALALMRAIKSDRISADSIKFSRGSRPADDGGSDDDDDTGGGGEDDEPLPSIDELVEDGEEEEEEEGRRGADSMVAKSAEFAMGAFFLRQYDERLRVLHEGVTADFTAPVPYLVSKQFADLFRKVLMDRFVDRVIDANFAAVKRCDAQEPDKRDAYLENMFENIETRRHFFERWKGIWFEKTEQKKLPKKPKENKSGGGVLGMLSGKKSKNTMTLEEWEAAVAEVTADNEAAEAARAEIMAKSPDYMAPKEEDMEVLMNLFGRTPGGLEKQITAICQIGLQSRSTAAFDSYQQGRPVDLPLLAASFRHPQAFLGPKGFTRDLMRGYREAARVAAFPLVSRFIIDVNYTIYTPDNKDKRAARKTANLSAADDGGVLNGKSWEPIPEDPEREQRVQQQAEDIEDKEWEPIPDEPEED